VEPRCVLAWERTRVACSNAYAMASSFSSQKRRATKQIENLDGQQRLHASICSRKVAGHVDHIVVAGDHRCARGMEAEWDDDDGILSQVERDIGEVWDGEDVASALVQESLDVLTEIGFSLDGVLAAWVCIVSGSSRAAQTAPRRSDQPSPPLYALESQSAEPGCRFRAG
jgi:hypothetical protein